MTKKTENKPISLVEALEDAISGVDYYADYGCYNCPGGCCGPPQAKSSYECARAVMQVLKNRGLIND